MTAISFDIGGVLMPSAVGISYDRLAINGRNLPRERFMQLLSDERVLTGPKGTLEKLLQLDFQDLRVSVAEIVQAFRNIPKYEKTWEIARELKGRGHIVGIISDQWAESAEIVRAELPLDEFAPVLLSPEVRMSKKTNDIFDMGSRIVGYRRRFMIDDNSYPLINASFAGYTGIRFVSPEALRKSLERYGLL